MKKLYGKELAEQIKNEVADIRKIQERREKRIADWETDEDDCFVSIRTEEQEIRACEMKLHILEETDGTMEIDAIFDKNGNEVNTHWFTNKWGRSTIVGNGVFASSLNALLKKTGWTVKKIKVPQWVRFEAGCGCGMYAVYTGRNIYTRWHTNMVTGEYVGFPE